MRIKMGIIGLGKAWERLHAPAFARLTDKFTITAICDTDRQKAEAAARWMNLSETAVYHDYHQMLAEADIEAVDTMVPIAENFECAQAVLQRGKHLIAEKPLTHNMDSAKELIRLRKRTGLAMMVAENTRYDEENAIIRGLLSERRIGNPVYFIDNHVVAFPQEAQTPDTFASTNWRRHADFNGGVFLDSGVHHVARHRFFFGGTQTHYAVGHPPTHDFAPYSALHALLGFEEHVTGHYSFYLTGVESQCPAVGLRIFGTQGEIYLENPDCGFVNVSYPDGGHEAIPFTPHAGYYHELVNFYDALRHGKEIVSTPEKAAGDMETVFEILESAEKLDRRSKLKIAL